VTAEAVPDEPGYGELVARARAGDGAATDEIVRRLMPLVWNVARAQGLDQEAAADVVQSTWLAFVEQLDELRDPPTLPAWLITVTKRLAWRAREAGRRDRHLDPDAWEARPDPAGDLEERVADDERNLCLWRNLRLLPPRCQELLRIAAFVDRPSYLRLAEAIGMPRGSIGPTRARCLDKLRRLLGGDPTWTGQ
jgi:RNA polymerase sigma factor (sigma-70 family)